MKSRLTLKLVLGGVRMLHIALVLINRLNNFNFNFSRIPLAGARGVRIVAHSIKIVLMNRLNKTESGVYLICRFSLILMDPFCQIITWAKTCELILCWEINIR